MGGLFGSTYENATDRRVRPTVIACQQCIPQFGGLAGSYSTINFIQAAGFALPTQYHVRQGGACAPAARQRLSMLATWMSACAARLAAPTDVPYGYSFRQYFDCLRRRGPISAVADSIADVGAVVIRWVETLGDMALFMWRTLSWLVSGCRAAIR